MVISYQNKENELWLFKGEQLIGKVPSDRKDIAYNDFIGVFHHLLKVSYKKNSLVIYGILEIKDRFKLIDSDVKFRLNDNEYEVKYIGPKVKIKSHKLRFYKAEIPYADIGKIETVWCKLFVSWANSEGLGFIKGIKYNCFDRKKSKKRTKKIKIVKEYNFRFRVFQNKKNFIIINKRPLYEVIEGLILQDSEDNSQKESSDNNKEDSLKAVFADEDDSEESVVDEREEILQDSNGEEFQDKYEAVLNKSLPAVKYDVYKNAKLIRSYNEEAKNCVYNSLIKIYNHLLKVSFNDDKLVIKAVMFLRDPFDISKNKKFFVSLNGVNYDIKKIGLILPFKSGSFFFYKVEIPLSDITKLEIHTRLNFCFLDESGFGISKPLIYNIFDGRKTRYRTSRIKTFEDINTCIYVRQSAKNSIFITNRIINTTDSRKENRKINTAYFLSKFIRAKNIALFYEKEAKKFEESASVLFERLIEKGYKNIYYVIDRDSEHYCLIDEKYKANIIHKFSFKHYLYFFKADCFLGTEAMGHAIELRIRNRYALKRIYESKYKYVFLQHGITYMLSLKSSYRSIFKKNGSFPKKGKVVVSSLLEAEHFVEYGNFKFKDLYISGLPKFDRSRRNERPEKIVIMPTWRPWDYNIIRINPLESSYFNFIIRIFEQIPKEYLNKVVLLPHPLFKETLPKNELSKYIPEHFVYDNILKETSVLITDYSSISYDAFYRGANVIFCWEEKDYCMSCYNNTLLLNDDNVFADVSYEYEDIGDLIRKNYNTVQSPEYIARFRKIVEFHDNNNTDRLIKMMENDGYLSRS